MVFAATRLLQPCAQLLLTIAQACRLLIVLSADCGIFFFYGFRYLRAQFSEAIGSANILHAYARCRLIHEVDRLIGQETICDIAL